MKNDNYSFYIFVIVAIVAIFIIISNINSFNYVVKERNMYKQISDQLFDILRAERQEHKELLEKCNVEESKT